MIKMMIAFFKDWWKYRPQIKKQDTWIRKFAKKKNYALNPNWMMHTNLEIWLTEMEETFGKRYCPCFEPSGNMDLDKRMLCPCKFLDDEIAEYGTCHCTLFGSPNLSKEGWAASNKRLMAEYRVPLKRTDNVIDTRGMPMDKRRNLPVPDAMHQLKSTLNNGAGGDTLVFIVEREQEAINMEKVAAYRGFGSAYEAKDDHYEVTLKLDGTTPSKGSRSSCGS